MDESFVFVSASAIQFDVLLERTNQRMNWSSLVTPTSTLLTVNASNILNRGVLELNNRFSGFCQGTSMPKGYFLLIVVFVRKGTYLFSNCIVPPLLPLPPARAPLKCPWHSVVWHSKVEDCKRRHVCDYSGSDQIYFCVLFKSKPHPINV